MIDHINKSIQLAENYQSKLCQAIMEYDGMCSYKTRHLFNNLCNLEGITYCEVGVYKGACSSSAIFNNKINSILIDNWSQFAKDFNVNGKNNSFRDTKEQFLFNVGMAHKYSTIKPLSVNILEKNYKEIILPKDVKIDIYFYDGDHQPEHQKNGIKHFYNNFNNQFILIVDDFWTKEEADNETTKQATFEAITELNLKIKYYKHLNGYIHDDIKQKMNTWWNGIGIFLLEK